MRYMLCLVCWIAVCAASPAEGQTAATKPARALRSAYSQLEAYGNQFKTLDIQFTVESTFHIKGQLFHDIHYVDMQWDRAGRRINSTSIGYATSLHGMPYIQKWVRNGETEWHSMPEGIGSDTGTWHVQLSPPAKGFFGTIDSVHGVPYLTKMLTPIHQLIKRRLHDGTMIMLADQKIDPKTGHAIITYDGRKGDKVLGQIIYDLDLSGGFKICSATSQDPAGKIIDTRLTYSDYHKVDGLWFPYQFQTEDFDIGKPNQAPNRTLITVKKIAINVPFGNSRFIYDPPFGSKVHDEISKATYRLGYKNPTAPLGKDVNDLRRVDRDSTELERILKSTPTGPAHLSDKAVIAIPGTVMFAKGAAGKDLSRTIEIRPLRAGVFQIERIRAGNDHIKIKTTEANQFEVTFRPDKSLKFLDDTITVNYKLDGKPGQVEISAYGAF